MVVRFKESVRIRLWGKEFSSFLKGEVQTVPVSVAGVLLAQGCVEPVPASEAGPSGRSQRLAS